MEPARRERALAREAASAAATRQTTTVMARGWASEGVDSPGAADGDAATAVAETAVGEETAAVAETAAGEDGVDADDGATDCHCRR